MHQHTNQLTITAVEDQMLNQIGKTCFSRIREMNKFYKKTEKCWKETTQKRLDSEKVQRNHFLGDSINQLDLK
jgi:hypothetical protein